MSQYFFLGLLLHLVGDYLLQNDWLANEKTKNTWACFIHVFLYSFGFWFILDLQYWLIVSVSHFFIDRFRLAVYWIKLVNWNWHSKNFGYTDDKPLWMSVWLMIIIDNTFHVIFNSIAIYLQHK